MFLTTAALSMLPLLPYLQFRCREFVFALVLVHFRHVLILALVVVLVLVHFSSRSCSVVVTLAVAAVVPSAATAAASVVAATAAKGRCMYRTTCVYTYWYALFSHR